MLRNNSASFTTAPTYTPKEAVLNGDVVVNNHIIYNKGRLFDFLDNLERGEFDKINITTYGVDGPAKKSILEYDGNMITHTVDTSGYGNMEKSRTYYGICIVEILEIKYDHLISHLQFTAPDKRHEVLSYFVRKIIHRFCPDTKL